ncbi:hypothetical protein MTBGP_11500 [Moorella thermoacetica]|uniref:nucleotide-binding protein n=1 Tax=Neomoorella thermoacetica TaxID=1525 RepID=UPI0030D03C9F
MRCLICAENGAAGLIKEDLIKTGLYKNWEFVTCGDAREMLGYARERPDVLVVSRFLPGMDPVELLDRMPTMFPASHIVLLAGRVDEKGRGYINAAMKRGLTNIVTGKLPGDRPYTLLEALTANREVESILEDEEVIDSVKYEEGGDDRDSSRGNNWGSRALEDKEEAKEAEKRLEKTPVFKRDTGIFEGAKRESIERTADVPQRDDFDLILSGVYETQESTSLEQKPTRDVIKDMRMSSPSPGQGTMRKSAWNVSGRKGFGGQVRGKKGVLVLTAANKGGVGKTTVGITLAVALARAGVPVVLWDLDFGASDVVSFFEIAGVDGIEALARGNFRPEVAEELLVRAEENLYVLPGPMDRTVPAFEPGEIGAIAQHLLSRFPVVLGDTPPEFWTKPWLEGVFPLADKVLAVVDQSKFSEQETATYAPCLLAMGVAPEKISIVLNRYSPRLHNAKAVEKYFCSGFKKDVPAKMLPRVAAVIPEEWEAYVQRGYKGEVVGLDDAYSQWHALAEEIASAAGYTYRRPEGEKKALFRFFGGKKK